MSAFGVFATITTRPGSFSWINHRWVKLSTTIGLMVIARLNSLTIVVLHALAVVSADLLVPLARHRLPGALLSGMLGALLFAGALHLQWGELVEQKWAIALLATGSVVLSTLIVAVASW